MTARPFFPHEKPHVDDVETPLAAFEKKLGERLPDDYRSFVAELGGAAPDGTLSFSVPGPGWKWGSFEVAAFYGLGAGKGSHDLAEALEAFGDRVPSEMIPIATSRGGNQVCLAIRGTRRGEVLVWARDLYPVAPSFTVFLDALVFRPADQIMVPSSFPTERAEEPEIDDDAIVPLLAPLRPAATDADDATWRQACVEDCLMYDDPAELRSFLAEVFTAEDASKLDAVTKALWALRKTAVST
jgi:SMI1 / KNR4 family (SUKH-1)